MSRKSKRPSSGTGSQSGRKPRHQTPNRTATPLCIHLIDSTLNAEHERLLCQHDWLPENIDKAAKLNNRAHVLSNAGRHKESEALHKEALILKLATFGPDSIQAALTRNALGMEQLRQGELEEAEFSLTEAVRIRNTVPDFDGAVSRENLAQLLEAKGDLSGASELRLSRPNEMACANHGVSP